MNIDKQTSPVSPSVGAAPLTGPTTGYVAEVFCSVQGEGIFLGQRQVFLRMAGCSATCSWCDTVSSKKERTTCLVHGETKKTLTNPLTVEQIVDETLGLMRAVAPIGAVSITGGEPLEQSEFVADIAKQLRRKKLRIYLETSGLEVEGFKRVRPLVDVVSVDIKLPHATGHEHWDVHSMFLRWMAGKTGFVKVVVDSASPMHEIKHAVRIIAETDRGIPLVLQPESTSLFKAPAAERKTLLALLEEAQRFALEQLRDVRVIPQCHKVLKVR